MKQPQASGWFFFKYFDVFFIAEKVLDEVVIDGVIIDGIKGTANTANQKY